jgi:hypothetical protein
MVSGWRERSSAKYLVFAQRLEGGLRYGNDGQRVAQGIEHLGAVAACAIWGDMVLDELNKVAALQAVLRQIQG